MLECVVNISEGRDPVVLDRLSEAVRADLLDRHVDPHHNRSVFTLLGEDAPRLLTSAAIEAVDLRRHQGVHPRIGVVDVVPFVALDGTPGEAAAARDRFCDWAGRTLSLPCFRYGDERSLPEVRRGAFDTLVPDCGPPRPHPTAGGCAVGARPLLVAYNVWVTGGALATVRAVAAAVRTPQLRTLGLQVGDRFQVSCNLVVPHEVGPREAVDRITDAAARHDISVQGTELVGLVPASVLDAIDPDEWQRLDLAPERTIEARIARRPG